MSQKYIPFFAGFLQYLPVLKPMEALLLKVKRSMPELLKEAH